MGIDMVKADKKIKERLENIENNPENISIILDIIRHRHNHTISMLISKAILHHPNFESAEKCKIMEDIVYRLILTNLKHWDIATLYNAELCIMPLEGKKDFSWDSEKEIAIHLNRVETIYRVYDRLSENKGIDIVRNKSAKDPKVLSLMRRVRENIKNRYKDLGFALPKRYESAGHKQKMRNVA